MKSLAGRKTYFPVLIEDVLLHSQSLHMRTALDHHSFLTDFMLKHTNGLLGVRGATGVVLISAANFSEKDCGEAWIESVRQKMAIAVDQGFTGGFTIVAFVPNKGWVRAAREHLSVYPERQVTILANPDGCMPIFNAPHSFAKRRG